MMGFDALKKVIKKIIGERNIALFMEKYALFQDMKKNKQINTDFKKQNASFACPPMSLAFDAYGSTNLKLYHDMGFDFAMFVVKILKPHFQTQDKMKIFEWGCGPGRIIRHLPNIETSFAVEIFGSDYNLKTINWCRKNIGNVTFHINQLTPPLSFDSNFFNAIYVFSVFTHLSTSMQLAWSQELLRILKPGGIIIITTHGDNFVQHLTESEKNQYASGESVVREKVKEGTRDFSAWHPPEFVKRKLLEGFSVIEHMPKPDFAHLKQDIWIARKNECPKS
jgi:SAM-dependent methyltransferase